MNKLQGLILVLCIAAIAGWHFYDKQQAVDAAYKNGLAVARAETQKQTLEDLTAIINNAQVLVEYAGAISGKIQTAINARETYDQQTTKEIRNALSRTATTRIRCNFDDDIMQQLAAARNRANEAATIGIEYPLSTGARTD